MNRKITCQKIRGPLCLQQQPRPIYLAYILYCTYNCTKPACQYISASLLVFYWFFSLKYFMWQTHPDSEDACGILGNRPCRGSSAGSSLFGEPRQWVVGLRVLAVVTTMSNYERELWKNHIDYVTGRTHVAYIWCRPCCKGCLHRSRIVRSTEFRFIRS